MTRGEGMFSENGTISEKQMRRMLILPVYASLIFVVPYLAANLFGESVVWGLVIFFAFACIYVAYIFGVEKWFREKGKNLWLTGEGTAVENRKVAGKMKTTDGMKMAESLLIIIQILRMIVRLGFYISLTKEVLSKGQVPYMPEDVGDNPVGLLVVLPLLLVALYCAAVKSGKKGNARNCGMEQQARIYELMFWMMFVPFVLVIIFGISEVNFSVFVPHWNMSVRNMLICGYLLLSFALPVENYLLLRPFLREKENGKSSFFAVIGSVLLVCVLTLFVLGIYGVHGAAQQQMVSVDIMRYIRLPFGFLPRVDAMLVWFYLVGCFVLVAQTLYFAGLLLSRIFVGAKRVWLVVVVLVVALVVAAFQPAYSSVIWLYCWYGATLDFPLSLLLPILGMQVVRFEKSEVDA
jgi:spore germination protein